MEKELFESVKKAADAAKNSPSEENRCLDALERLKEFPVNYQLLISTQVGKRLRQLTKHQSNKIKALSSNVMEIWKNIIVEETLKNKKNGTYENGDSVKAEPVKVEHNSVVKNVKVDKTSYSGSPKSEKAMKLEASSYPKIEKVKVS